jgi:hypothetical protein
LVVIRPVQEFALTLVSNHQANCLATMDALAATATVVQVSIYAYNVAQALQELCETIRKGHAKLREQCKRLEVLEIVVRKIEQDTRLHRQEVINYLVTVREHILRLHGLLLHKLGSQRDTFLRRLRSGLSLLRAKKQIRDAFASLAEDSSCLTLYMSNYKPSPPATPSMAPNQQRRFPPVNERGELVPETTQEVSVSQTVRRGDIILNPFCKSALVPYQQRPQRGGPEDTSPVSSDAQDQEAGDAASTAPIEPDVSDIDQDFQDISATGGAIVGQASSNELGNLKAAALKGSKLKQVFRTIKAEDGGKNRMGNIG